jgi:antitoxin component YwqK of YwqJK toxin-antitoxin module
MKKFAYLFSLLILVVACGEQEKEKPKKIEVENLIEIKDGIYKEFYPGKKEVRITGPVGDNNVREGKWTFLAKNGTEMSICFYENGKKNGHSIVKHPNGAISYVGEYINDKQIGIWEFYDEKGKLINTTDYGQPKE